MKQLREKQQSLRKNAKEQLSQSQATINQKNYFGYNPFYSQTGNTKISLNRDESAKSLNRTGSRHSTYSTRT